MDNNSSQFLYGTPSPIGQVTNISINDPVRVAYGSLDKAMIKIGNGTDSMIAFGYDTDLKSAIVVAHGMLASSKIIDISVKDKEIGNTIDITYVDTNSKAIKHLSFDTIDDEDALELLQTFNASLITLLNDVSDGLYNKINDTSDAIIEYIDTQDSSLLKLLNDVSDGILEELKKDELAMMNSYIALAEAAGTIDENENIAYQANSNASYISTATSLANADDILDAAIADVADSVKDISLDIFNASTALKQYVDAQDTSIVNKLNDVSEGLFKKINDTSNALKTYIDDQDTSLLTLLNDVSDGLYDLIQNSSAMKDYIDTQDTSIVNKFNDVSEGLFKKINDTSNALKAYIDAQDTSTVNKLNDVSEGLFKKINDTSNALKTYIDAQDTSIVNKLNNVSDGIISKFNDVSDGLYNLIINSSSSLKDYIDTQDTSIVNKFNDVSDGLFKKINDTSNALKTYIDNQDTSIVNKLNDVSEGLFKKINDTSNALKTYIDNQDTSIVNKLNDVSEGLFKKINDTSNALKTYIDDQDTSIVSKLNDVSDGLFNLIMDTSDSLKEYIDEQDASLLALLNDVSDGIITEIKKDERVIMETFSQMSEATGLVNSSGNISYVPDSNASYISSATSLAEADSLLDAAITDLAASMPDMDDLKDYIDTQDSSLLALLNDVSEGIIREILEDENALANNIIALAQSAGTINSSGDIEYIPDLSSAYISSATSLSEADSLLDEAISDLADQIDGLGDIKEYIDTQDSSIFNILNDVSEGIIKNFNDASDGLYNMLINDEQMFSNAISHLQDTIDSVSDGIISELNDVSDGLYNLIMDTSDSLKEYVDEQDSSLLQLLNDVSDGIITEIENDELVIMETFSQLSDAVGLVNSSGNIQYEPDAGATYISGATSLTEADSLLDAAISDVIADVSDIKEYVDMHDSSLLQLLNDVSDGIINEILEDEEVTQKSIVALGTAAGTLDPSGNIVYIPDPNAAFVSEATSLADAIMILDDALANFSPSGDSSLMQLLNDVSDGIIRELQDDEDIIADSIISIGEAAGILNSSNAISYTPVAAATYISSAQSLYQADVFLDAALSDLSDDLNVLSDDLSGLQVYIDNSINSVKTIIDNSINYVKTIIADVSQAKADKVKIVNHGTSDTTFALTPNVHHQWGTVSSLTLTLAAPTDNTIVNEYQFSFTSPSVPTTLSLPATVDWVFELIVEEDKTYTVSIVNNLATYLTSDMSIIGADEAVLNLKEDIANKVTSIDVNSTDIQYPSAKCVYDYIEARLSQLSGNNISYTQGSESYNDF